MSRQLPLHCERCGHSPGKNARRCPLCRYFVRQAAKHKKERTPLECALGVVCFELGGSLRAVYGGDWSGSSKAWRQAQILFAMQAARL